MFSDDLEVAFVKGLAVEVCLKACWQKHDLQIFSPNICLLGKDKFVCSSENVINERYIYDALPFSYLFPFFPTFPYLFLPISYLFPYLFSTFPALFPYLSTPFPAFSRFSLPLPTHFPPFPAFPYLSYPFPTFSRFSLGPQTTLNRQGVRSKNVTNTGLSGHCLLKGSFFWKPPFI